MMKVLLCALALLVCTPSFAETSDDNSPYAALIDITKLKPSDPGSRTCIVDGTVDFARFHDKLGIFREAYLNKELSLEFYAQREKQVLSYIVLKHDAELITEGMYNGRDNPECKFSLSISYNDKFGQPKTLQAVTWKFNNEQSRKVNWEKFNPRDFADVALDYNLNPALTEWVSSEPRMGGDKPAAANECDMFLFNANAVFIRATTFCRKNWAPPKTSRFRPDCDSLGIEGLEAVRCGARLGSSTLTNA